MKIKHVVILALFLLIPSVSAAYPATEATQYATEYTLFTGTYHVNNPAIGSVYYTQAYTDAPKHDYQIISAKTQLEILLSIQNRDDNTGTSEYKAFLDGQPLPGCMTRASTRSLIAGATVSRYITLYCEYTPTAPHDSTPRVLTISIAGVGGNPSGPDHLTTAVEITRTDVHMIPQDANEILEVLALFAPLILAAILLVAAGREEIASAALLLYGTAFVGMLGAIIALPEEYAAIRFMLVALELFTAAKIALLSLEIRNMKEV